MMDATQKLQREERASRIEPADTLSPADRYQELFVAVQTQRVFDDSKTFVDCVPQQHPEAILTAYREQKAEQGFDLEAFVHRHFTPPTVHVSHYVSDPGQTMKEHIDALWDVLSREPNDHPEHSSLLPLPNTYVVPGGRFGELYYWDSYFTMLGLAESGRHDLLRAMADNFAYLIDTYGHVPNGNRTYYLSRSQPPVFALMVELFEEHGVSDAIEYLPQLCREYSWWMSGSGELPAGQAHRHCVRLPDGSLFNRYWDERDTPREESYLEDVLTARKSSRPAHETYLELRAGATSGWDFSSRWCDGDDLSSIRTTAIVPVDLNSFMYKLERQISLLSEADGQTAQAETFRRHAEARAAAIGQWLWHEEAGAYLDYDWCRAKPREQLNAATVTPLFIKLASDERAAAVSRTIRERLIDDGGLSSTLRMSGQQWDQPNGWAPLQWMAISGLRHYNDPLGDDIASRWLHTVSNLYERESKMVEKYVLTRVDGEHTGGGGGEYPLQDGFGWTNGVTRRLLHEDPHHRANQARAIGTD